MFFFEAGKINDTLTMFVQPKTGTEKVGFYDYNEGFYYTNIGAKITMFDLLSIGGEAMIIEEASDHLCRFHPFQSDFKFYTSLKYNFIAIGYEHWCLHPIASGKPNADYTYKIGVGDKFYVRFEIQQEY